MFNMAIIINIMRSPHTSSRLMMWWTCRQEVGRSVGRSGKPRLSGGRRLGWCVFVLRDEKIRQLSAVALSSRSAALRKQSYDLNEAVSFFVFFPSPSFFLSEYRSIPPVLRQQYNTGGASSPGAFFPSRAKSFALCFYYVCDSERLQWRQQRRFALFNAM